MWCPCVCRNLPGSVGKEGGCVKILPRFNDLLTIVGLGVDETLESQGRVGVLTQKVYGHIP